MKAIAAIFSLALLALASPVFADTQDFSKVYEAAQQLIEDGKCRIAASKLDKLLSDKKLSDSDRGKATVLLAMAYRKDGHVKQAVEALEKLSSGRGDMYWLELGEAYLELKSFDKAVEAAQTYGSSKSLSLKADGAWLRARAEYGRKSYKDCYLWCDKFRQGVESARAEAEEKGEAELAHLKYFDPLLVEAKKLRELARELYETEVYGKDYANYRKGRSAQFEGDWTSAVFFYKCVKFGTLKDASDCYAAECVAARGDCKDAEKMFQEFIKASPFGLYREEARLLLAEARIIAGKGDSCMKEALDDIDGLLDALPKMSENDEANAKLSGINQALEDDIINTAPKEPSHADDCGNLIRYAKRPETIDNRITSPWYLDEIETRAWLLKSYLLGEMGRKSDAAAACKKAEEVGGGVKILTDSGTISNLLAGLAEGSYMLPGESEEKLKGRGARLLSYASFLYVSERKDDAWKVFEMAEAEFGKDRTPVENASLKLVKAQMLLGERGKRRKEADTILTGIYEDKRLRRTPFWPMAALLYANSLTNNAGSKAKAYAIYKDIANEEHRGDYAPRSLMSMAAFAANIGDKRTAIDTCTELRNRYVKTPYRHPADTLREALEKAEEGAIVEPIERSDGKVVVFTRTLVIPGGSRWKPNTDGLTASDVVLYNIKCIGRDNCTVVKGVGMNFPPDEPQVPSSKGNQLFFVRIPILYVKSLRYNFDELLKPPKAQSPPAATAPSAESKS